MFQPPSQPAADWYPDPHVPGHRRWWNGRDWEERWDPPLPLVGAHGLPDIGDWLGRAVRRAWANWPAACVVSVFTNAVPTLLMLLLAKSVVDDVVITTDGDVIGWSNDRIAPALGFGLVVMLLFAVGTLAMQALMLRAVDDQPGGSEPPAKPIGRRAGDAIRTAIRCLPRAVGWFGLLAIAGALAAIAAALLLAVSPAFGVLIVLAAAPLFVWLLIRWAFIVVAIVDAPGNPFRRSSDVVSGRWWAVFGRLVLLWLIIWAVTFVVNIITSLVSGGAGGQALEVDGDGNLVDDLVLADFFPTTTWPIVVTVVGGLIVSVVTTVSGAGLAELYRRHHPVAAD